MQVPTLQDCIVGVALWVVWYAVGNRQVYPAKVVHVLGGGLGLVHVKAHFYQDNGYAEEVMTLREEGLKPEAQIKAASRTHLDWAFRSTPIPGEVEFQQAALGDTRAAGAGPSRENKRPRSAATDVQCNAILERLQQDLLETRHELATFETWLATMDGRMPA